MPVDVILRTKLFRPPCRDDFIARPRLCTRIDAGRQRRLVLITAPAGYGKSTLMAEWARQTDLPVAWLSLDKTDADPGVFLQYMIAALQTVLPGLGSGVVSLLDAPNPPGVDALVNALLNEIAGLDGEIALLLDDFHVVRNPDVIDVVCALIADQPPQLHLVIASRGEMPFSCARLRGRDELVELGIDELRFRPEEVLNYLRSRLGGRVTAAEAKLLGDRAEGWIAGLQLAVLSLRSGQDLGRALDRLSGYDRHITDYLMDEVLARQSPEVLEFLLQTSVLDKLTAPLCAVVTGNRDSQRLLEYLDRSGLFVIPLDSSRTWYRYHHLFAEMLYRRLEGQAPGQAAALHRQAAAWFFQHGLIEDAVEHSLDAHDYGTVTEYLQGIIDHLLARGQFATYLRWLDRIPDRYLTGYPKLVLYRVFQLWEMGSLDKFRGQLRLAEEMLGPTPEDLSGLDPQTAAYHGILAVVKGVVKCGDYAVGEAAPFFARALRLLPEDMSFWRVLSLGATGFCRRVAGDYAAASEYFAQVIDRAPEAGLDLLCFMYTIAQAQVLLATGRLREAIAACKLPLSLDEQRDHNVPFAGLAYAVMGELLYYAGDLTAAEEHLKRGVELIVSDGDAYSLANGYLALARIALARGDQATAQARMDELLQELAGLAAPESALIVARAYQASIWIACEQYGRAKQWAGQAGEAALASRQYPEILGLSYFGVYCTVHEPLEHYAQSIRLTLARLEVAAGNAREALEILDALLEIVPVNRVFFRVQVLLVRALALAKAGSVDAAAAALLAAIRPIAAEPLDQLFLGEGRPVYSLLLKARSVLAEERGRAEENAPAAAFVERLIGHLSPIPAPPAGAGDLTQREIETLKWLAGGLGYDEIAGQLIISRNTVKTYLKRIYSKLDVSNRLQAVNKAKELGLLP